MRRSSVAGNDGSLRVTERDWSAGRSLLRVYARIPGGLRQRAVRLVQPSYTLAVMPVITSHDGEILLVRHSYMGGWGLPGGLVDRRERVEVALVREAREEVGLEIALSGALAVVVDLEDQVVRVISRAQPVERDAAPTPSSAEIVETRWFGADALPTLVPASVEAMSALARTEAV